jgi:hypothetical protein
MNDTITYKTCSKCGVDKPLTRDNFHFANKSKNYFKSNCISCSSVKKKPFKWELESVKAFKTCFICNIEKSIDNFYFNDNRKSYKNDCKLCFNNRQKNYYGLNKSNRIDYQVKRYSEKSDILIEYQKEYNDVNKEKTNNRRSVRKKTDTLYALKLKIRSVIRSSFIRKSENKNKESIKILGCSITYFKSYIESQFKEGMTWDNHGQYGWHLDHIIPVSSAKTEQELYKLNHYTNFQPLWWYENLSKGDKISKEWGND